MDPIKLLTFNAGLQILFSSLFGVVMLVPMQPWGKALRAKIPAKASLAAHLDWIMLGLAQGVAAVGISAFGSPEGLVAPTLLIFGGWVNPTPYLFRGFGVNAFVLGGGRLQVLASSLAGLSSLAIIAAWSLLLYSWSGAW